MSGDNKPLLDNHGRIVNYLRLSLTDACNFRCGFCKPDAPTNPNPEQQPCLTPREMLRLCAVFAHSGIRHFKITGGEPLMRPDAISIISTLKTLANVDTVTVTTNGSTLARDAARLAAVPVDGLNVSLNAMSQENYHRIVGVPFPLQQILDAILLAKNTGLRIKLNMVPLRGLNDSDIVPLLEFALEHDITVRFIELMPLGRGRLFSGLPFAEVLRHIENRFGPATETPERLGNGPAAYLALPGFSARIGSIAAVSQKFCQNCNRIRLDSAGYLRTCLHHGRVLNLRHALRLGETDEQIASRIRAAVTEKPEHHCFDQYPNNLGLEPMYRIGG